MPLNGEYLGMDLFIADNDTENLAYYEFCAARDFRLQRWKSNGLLSFPPGAANPWDGTPDFEWAPVEGSGTVMSYCEVHHAIMPSFRDQIPYQVLLVELDTQRAEPSEHEAIRIIGNLANEDGTLASPEQVQAVGIGTRVRMVFFDVGEKFAIPQWVVDETAEQPEKPWRYSGT